MNIRKSKFQNAVAGSKPSNADERILEQPFPGKAARSMGKRPQFEGCVIDKSGSEDGKDQGKERRNPGMKEDQGGEEAERASAAGYDKITREAAFDPKKRVAHAVQGSGEGFQHGAGPFPL